MPCTMIEVKKSPLYKPSSLEHFIPGCRDFVLSDKAEAEAEPTNDFFGMRALYIVLTGSYCRLCTKSANLSKLIQK